MGYTGPLYLCGTLLKIVRDVLRLNQKNQCLLNVPIQQKQNKVQVIKLVFSCNNLGIQYLKGFPGGSEGTESVCHAGDPGSIPGLGRSPGERNGNLLQYSYLENPMDGGAWQATVHGVAKSWTRLCDFTFTLTQCSHAQHQLIFF